MEIAIGTWLVFCIVVAIAANARGRSGIGWFLLSLLISPLFGLILVLVLSRKNPHAKMRVDVYDGGTRRHQRVRLDEAIPAEDVEWVSQEILRQGVCTYRGWTIRDASSPKIRSP
jgi:hypothetical protein